MDLLGVYSITNRARNDRSRMKVLFVQNNGIQESIGVANLSGILKANGHHTDLLLVSHTPDLIGAIRQYDPGLIAFSALTGVHHSIQRLAVSDQSNTCTSRSSSAGRIRRTRPR